MAANPEESNVQLDDIFAEEDNIDETLEPDKEGSTEKPAEPDKTMSPVELAPTNKPPIEPKVEEPVVDTSKEETTVETPVESPAERPVQPEAESKELGELKYLRDIVFSDEKIFNQVMQKAKGEPAKEPEAEIVMPEFPEDDTDPAAMKKYYEDKDAAIEARTQRQIQEAIASERKRSLEEQQKVRQQTIWSTAMNSVRTENKLDQEQLGKFVQWAKNPFGNDAGKYVKHLYKLYQEVHTPEIPKEKGSVLTNAAKNIQTKTVPGVNAANLGGGNENSEPLSENDQFNEDLFKEINKVKKW
jgi:hypothetical protein